MTLNIIRERRQPGLTCARHHHFLNKHLLQDLGGSRLRHVLLCLLGLTERKHLVCLRGFRPIPVAADELQAFDLSLYASLKLPMVLSCNQPPS